MLINLLMLIYFILMLILFHRISKLEKEIKILQNKPKKGKIDCGKMQDGYYYIDFLDEELH